jgi:hypothetical protein
MTGFDPAQGSVMVQVEYLIEDNRAKKFLDVLTGRWRIC